MLRGVSTIARRCTVQSRGLPTCSLPMPSAFHSSAPREEEAKITAPVATSKGGLFGTGLSEWYALPIGITAAIPIIKFDWYVMNEETQLAAVFVAFCVALYSSGGDAIHKALDEKAQTLLKEHNEAEDKVIAALQQKLEFLKANRNMVNDFEAINQIREQTYARLNAAGAVRPKHEFKAQMERVLNMIAQEESSVTEKTKISLMRDATEHVRAQFSSNKNLKKAALDDAIAQIKAGSASKSGVDPVRAEFINFFKNKASEAGKNSGEEESKAARAALVAKLNAVCKSEGFYFHFDAQGHPKMNA